MAVRLPVVLCQHERRTGKFSDHEEEWITTLLFEDRLDATLISDLGSIEKDSTDHLCLEGLKGDFVLVAWRPKEFVIDQLTRLGFSDVEIVPIDGSAKVFSQQSGAIGTKKVYYWTFDLTVSVSHGIKQVKQLLASRSTPVFQIGGVRSSTKIDVAPQRNPDVLPVIAIATSVQNPPGIAESNTVKARVDTEFSEDSNRDEEFPNIDTWMQEMDDFE